MNNYTEYNSDRIMEHVTIYKIDDAVERIRNTEAFGAFDQGLIEVLIKKGYSGDPENISEMSGYLISKLEGIHSSIKKNTVVSWLSGEHRPKIEAGSRVKMYEICFSLNLTYEETIWFFQHVYFDRAFNCHTIEEAVFFYAFLNGISYGEAREIIHIIEEAPVAAVNNNIEPNYTMLVQKRIRKFQSTDELKEFLIANKENFRTWNISASKILHDLAAELLGAPEIKEDIEALKRRLTDRIKDEPDNIRDWRMTEEPVYGKCGLLMKEILFDADYPDEVYGNARRVPVQSVLELIEKRNVYSNTFILERLLTTSLGMKKNIEIPYVIKNNFPSKKVMSDILSEEKISTSKSYDSIRKMIILLDFYRFWVNVKLKIGYTELTEKECIETYYEETNDCLYRCGYEGLCENNLYDRIFIISAQTEAPLVCLRSCIAEMDDIS